jgi:two-component system chemotaxis response regulator CheB
MSFKVLIVDDSAFYRRRVREIINQDPMLTVVAEANNGEVAIEKVAEFKPDVITMDVEMPVMDGITAVRKIMQSTPTPILMFSSITHDGAQATLDALDAGALDFLPKNFVDIAKDRRDATTVLRAKVKSIAGRKINKTVMLRSNRLTSPGNTASTKKILSVHINFIWWKSDLRATQ